MPSVWWDLAVADPFDEFVGVEADVVSPQLLHFMLRVRFLVTNLVTAWGDLSVFEVPENGSGKPISAPRRTV